MKRLALIVFATSIIFVIGVGAYQNVAQAAYPYCEDVCFTYPVCSPNVICTCKFNPYLHTTCDYFCADKYDACDYPSIP